MPRRSEVENQPNRLKPLYIILFACLILLAIDNAPGAVTTPWGIIYLQEKTPELVRHEQCHFDRMKINPTAFYLEYFTGGACLEELRCADNKIEAEWILKAHPACTIYPARGIKK